MATLALRVNEERDKDKRQSVRIRHALLLKVRDMIPDAERYEEEEPNVAQATSSE